MELLEVQQDCCYGKKKTEKKRGTAKLRINRKTGPLQSDGKLLPSAEVVKAFGR